ncbi:hypothetical protein ACKI2N_001820 [Cupriavidus sp. 30B13]|uniref:hypothetical protein n=1 Tax=Cupriavidus sp. 30B13 TaxID=3384241 RepID=UPI003B8EFDDB
MTSPTIIIAWDKFPSWLIDHCEGQTITEEGLQAALADMLKVYPPAAATLPSPAVEPRLDAPAQVGNARFGKGIPHRFVIETAQRHHAYTNTPEKEAERIKRGKALLAELQTEIAVARRPSDTLALDVEQLLRDTVPGGSVCDPQQVADSIRAWFGQRAAPLDVEALRRAVENFDDGVDAEVPHTMLMAWAAQGLLECTRFTVTDKGRAALTIQGTVKQSAPSAGAQQAAPEGWQLVPVRPTDAMTWAGQQARRWSANSITVVYQDMLAAAPAPSASPAALTDSKTLALAEMVKAMRWWGAQEDGIPAECGKAFDSAMLALGWSYSHPQDLKVLAAPPAAPQPSAKALTFAAGIEAAAKWVDKRREDHDSEFGAADPDTGAFEFRSVPHEEYSAELYEVAEGIRAILAAEQPSEARAAGANDPQDAARFVALLGSMLAHMNGSAMTAEQRRVQAAFEVREAAPLTLQVIRDRIDAALHTNSGETA